MCFLMIYDLLASWNHLWFQRSSAVAAQAGPVPGPPRRASPCLCSTGTTCLRVRSPDGQHQQGLVSREIGVGAAPVLAGHAGIAHWHVHDTSRLGVNHGLGVATSKVATTFASAIQVEYWQRPDWADSARLGISPSVSESERGLWDSV